MKTLELEPNIEAFNIQEPDDEAALAYEIARFDRAQQAGRALLSIAQLQANNIMINARPDRLPYFAR